MKRTIPPFIKSTSVLLLLFGFLRFNLHAGALPAVPAARQPVTNSYHGITVTDDYQWLENAPTPEVREWTRLENERTRDYFSRLPYRETLAKELAKLRSEESARYFGLQERKGRIFALRFKP